MYAVHRESARARQHCIEFNIFIISLRYILIIHLLSSSRSWCMYVFLLFYSIACLCLQFGQRQNSNSLCVRAWALNGTDSMMITYFCQFSQLTYVHCREYHLNQKSKMADIVSLMLFYTYFSFWYVNMHENTFTYSLCSATICSANARHFNLFVLIMS